MLFQQWMYRQLRGLAAVMPDGGVIVVDARGRTPADRPAAHRIESVMTRFRAAVAHKDGKTVTDNALAPSGSIDDGTIAVRIRDATCVSGFPDTGVLMFDTDIVDQLIDHAIAEQCS